MTIEAFNNPPALTAEMIEAFSGMYLSERYDSPQPTPEFHRECWSIYASECPAAAIAAPRNHAKSTSLTHDYALSNAVFRAECYFIVVGASEEMAIEHLQDIANELRENEHLIQDFGIKEFVQDQKTDIIVQCIDGYEFRILARGAEQKIRGRKWRGRRPGLIICDDLEDDEQVENKDRRRKFRKWFFRACKQSLRDGGKIRVHGTILHEDSLLNHLMKNKQWVSKKYKAHKSFDDFSDILWSEKFDEARLRSIRQEFINEGDPAGYSQEYLNDPRDNSEAYLRPADFLPMRPEDFESFGENYVGFDFAISKADAANRTCAVVGKRDLDNYINIVDVRVARMDSLEIVDLFFILQLRWNVTMFYVEDGQIWKAIWPMLQKEILRREIYLSITPILPIKDKKTRGRSYQRMHRSGAMRFDKEAEWYGPYEDENLKFTGDSEALLDDQFDATATLCLGLDKYESDAEEDDQIDDEDLEEARMAEAARRSTGRNAVTGY